MVFARRRRQNRWFTQSKKDAPGNRRERLSPIQGIKSKGGKGWTGMVSPLPRNGSAPGDRTPDCAERSDGLLGKNQRRILLLVPAFQLSAASLGTVPPDGFDELPVFVRVDLLFQMPRQGVNPALEMPVEP